MRFCEHHVGRAHGLELNDEPGSARTANLALERFNDVGAIVVTRGDDGQLFVNIDHLTVGVIIAMHWLTVQLAETRGIDQAELIADLRHYLDG
jgi:hypothetical protein